MNTAAAVAVLIFDSQQRLLVTVREYDPAAGTFDLPGGFVDPGEKIEETVCREIKEELNLEITSLEYLFSEPNIYPYKGIRYATADMVFRCRIRDLSTIKAADDVRDYKFLPLAELEEGEFGLQSIRNVIKKYKNTIKDV